METLFIAKGSPWENGYVESFNGKLRDRLLNGEGDGIIHAVPGIECLVEAHCDG